MLLDRDNSLFPCLRQLWLRNCLCQRQDLFVTLDSSSHYPSVSIDLNQQSCCQRHNLAIERKQFPNVEIAPLQLPSDAHYRDPTEPRHRICLHQKCVFSLWLLDAEVVPTIAVGSISCMLASELPSSLPHHLSMLCVRMCMTLYRWILLHTALYGKCFKAADCHTFRLQYRGIVCSIPRQTLWTP
jgi:hypothetical protein